MAITLIKNAESVDLDAMRSTAGYLVEDEDLIAAANAAIALGKPLLLTGEPGIGKSEFAGWMAAQPETCDIHKFVVKSTTEASDLFYQFDTLARFRDAQIGSHRGSDTGDANARLSGGENTFGPAVHQYVRYNALGTAILHSIGRKKAESLCFVSRALGEETYASFPETASRSVVLIDEIDKAPRDVPNDILDEIEHLRFRAPELGNIEVAANPKLRPFVVITSNSERDLPKPFLRRCIYYHMRLSEDDGVLLRIAEQRVGARFVNNPSLLGDALRMFRHLRRDVALRHQPGLAELLDWLADLATERPGPGSRLADLNYAKRSLKNALLKNPDDQQLADSAWQEWIKHVTASAESGHSPDV